MPEGDTIFRAARALHKALAGKTVTRFESVFPKLDRVDQDEPIAGRTLLGVEARGKHLLMHLSGGLSLRTHMRMSGSWHIYRPGEAWQRPRAQLRILLETADFVAVAFLVHEAEWLREADMPRSRIAQLGPDLLSGDFDLETAVSRMQARGGEPICDVLLDQRALAGIGNVYKSEVLFLAGVHPQQPVRELSGDQLRELAALAQRLLRQNVHEDAPSSITTYRGLRRTTRRADPGERLWVYGRAGKPCRRCGSAIIGTAAGKHVRKTYHCPRCQVL
ncbi:MAG TPA: DNA-formamidopyrimidine glycosylase family protein [Polyangiales bacterium]|nr:DNA-formamidopyrimidine glycosylase family protein [Polyangiales bacterium]